MRKKNERVVTGILSAAMSAAILTACADKTPVEQPQTEETEAIPDAYEKILEEYKTMMSEKWDLEKISEKNLCTLVGAFYDDNAAAHTGYLLYDLNGDNQPELLIGETDAA